MEGLLGLLTYPFSVHETIFGLVRKKNNSLVKSVRNLDVKCKKNQTIPSSIVFTMAKYIVPLEQ